MLKTELDAKDVIIDALRKSMDEWKAQDQHHQRIATETNEKRNHDQTCDTLRTEKDEEFAKIRKELEEKDKLLEENKILINRQLTETESARVEIQEKSRIIEGLREQMSSFQLSVAEEERDSNSEQADAAGATTSVSKTNQNACTVNPFDTSMASITSDLREAFPDMNQDELTHKALNDEGKASTVTDRNDKTLDATRHSGSTNIANIPVGTVRARVAMVASRALKNAAIPYDLPLGVSYLQLQSKDDQEKKKSNAGNSTKNSVSFGGGLVGSRWKGLSGAKIPLEEHEQVLSELRENIELIQKLEDAQKVEVGKLMAEKIDYEHQISVLKKQFLELNDTLRLQSSKEDSVREEEQEKGKIEGSGDSAIISAKNIVSLVQEKDNLIQQLKIAHKAEVEKLTSEKQNIEGELQKSCKQSISKNIYEGVLDELQKKETQIQNLQEAHKSEIGELLRKKQSHEPNSNLIKKIEDSHKAQVSKLVEDKEEQNKLVAALYEKDEEIKKLEDSHKAKISELQEQREEQEKDLLALIRERDVQIQKLEESHKIQVGKLVEDKKEKEKLVSQLYGKDEQIKKLEEQHEASIQELQMEKEEHMRILSQNHESSALIQKLEESHKSQVQKLEDSHKVQVSKLLLDKEENEKLVAELYEKDNKIQKLEDAHKTQVGKLVKDKEENAKMIAALYEKDEEIKKLKEFHETQNQELQEQNDDHNKRAALQLQERDAQIQKLEESQKIQVKDIYEKDEQIKLQKDKIDVLLAGKEEYELIVSREKVKKTLDTEMLNKTNQGMDAVLKEKRELASKLEALEDEVETVTGLLEETIISIKEKDDEIDALKNKVGGNKERSGGVLGRFVANPKPAMDPKRSANPMNYSDEEVKQLERICKLHQVTIVRQRSEVKRLKGQLERMNVEAEDLRVEASLNEEKISVLETQFMELNKNTEQNHVEGIKSSGSDETTGASIIKIDAAYVASLESKSVRSKDTIEELQNQIKELKQRNEGMKQKMNMEHELRAQIDDLSTKLHARELEIKALEKTFSSKRSGSDLFRDRWGDEQESASNYDDDEEEMSTDEMKAMLKKRNAMVKQLRSKLSNLEQSLKTAGPRGAILNLRKVSLLQEMQDAIIRRLNVLINRIDGDTDKDAEEEVDECATPSRPFMIAMSDKLSLLHDYQKISLHLLESRLSNEIESLRSGGKPVEMDENIVTRFERTLEMMKKSEKEGKTQLDKFGVELDCHQTKLVAKNDVIETLLKHNREHQTTVECLRSELDIFKGLSKYSSVNVGVMARFKECSKLEQELEEKERVIERLNNVIEEYRYSTQ